MPKKTAEVTAWLASLPPDRQEALQAVRRVILDNLDPGFAEGMQQGMISYHVPHRLYPAGYHCNPDQPLPFACLAAQKQHLALYLMGAYMDPDYAAWFRAAWQKTGRKLDMGSSCVRFKKLEDVPLDVVGAAFRKMTAKRYIALYEAGLARPAAGKAGAKARKQASTRTKART
jgi:hypothetical protein